MQESTVNLFDILAMWCSTIVYPFHNYISLAKGSVIAIYSHLLNEQKELKDYSFPDRPSTIPLSPFNPGCAHYCSLPSSIVHGRYTIRRLFWYFSSSKWNFHLARQPAEDILDKVRKDEGKAYALKKLAGVMWVNQHLTLSYFWIGFSAVSGQNLAETVDSVTEYAFGIAQEFRRNLWGFPYFFTAIIRLQT